jgi:hypothetical protein
MAGSLEDVRSGASCSSPGQSRNADIALCCTYKRMYEVSTCFNMQFVHRSFVLGRRILVLELGEGPPYVGVGVSAHRGLP